MNRLVKKAQANINFLEELVTYQALVKEKKMRIESVVQDLNDKNEVIDSVE